MVKKTKRFLRSSKHNGGKKNHSKKDILTFFISTILIIVFDQLTKLLVYYNMPITNNGILDIGFVKNTGTFFGLFNGMVNSNIAFILVSILALVLLSWVIYLEKLYTWSFGILFGGIFGNLIDRITRGYVLDWINLHWWPVFNIADAALVVGVCFLLFKEIHMYICESKSSAKKHRSK